MYYPIIDKLKEVMADITSIKDKQPLIIEGTLTSTTGGTWNGNYAEIISASGNKPIYFKITYISDVFFIPLIHINESNAFSCLFNYADHTAKGIMYPDNKFVIDTDSK